MIRLENVEKINPVLALTKKGDGEVRRQLYSAAMQGRRSSHGHDPPL